MSELTKCNYCSLRSIEANVAGKQSVAVSVVKSDSDELLAQWPKAVDVLVNGRRVATFLELTEECAC